MSESADITGTEEESAEDQHRIHSAIKSGTY